MCIKKLFQIETSIAGKTLENREILDNTIKEQVKRHDVEIELLKYKITALEKILHKKKAKEEENVEASFLIEQVQEQAFTISNCIASLITLNCRLWLDTNNFVELTAILDTASSKSLVGHSLIPKKYHKELPYRITMRTAEQRLMTITHCVEALGIQFIDFAKNYSVKYEIPQISIALEETNSKDFLLGLNFICSVNGSVTIARNCITISKNVYSFPTNKYMQTAELAQKRGGQPTDTGLLRNLKLC